jgi:phosphoglycolate phosphatase-like HAD superfamily hydrolase
MSIGVTSGVYSAEELLPHRPTYLIDSLTELLDWVKAYQDFAQE